MPSATQTAPVSKKMLWAGRIISALPVLLLLFSGAMKLVKPAPVVQAFAHLGYPESLALRIGILELACTVVYLIPRTSVLGAILMTAYLGGATATHVRVANRSTFRSFLACWSGQGCTCAMTGWARSFLCAVSLRVGVAWWAVLEGEFRLP